MLTAQLKIAPANALSMQPVADFPDFSGVETFDQFAALVIERANLSRAASRVAAEDALRADVKTFARYELMEAETVVAVLEELGTPVPPMGGETWAALAQIINTPSGRSFDTAYMTTEYENHAFLQDLATAYLRNARSRTADARERHGRRLARVMLVAFAEHTSVTQTILRELAV